MQRQQTLADLLADDTGNLRPEVANLLMGRPRQRSLAPFVRRAARREITIRGWVLAVVALSFLVTIIFASSKHLLPFAFLVLLSWLCLFVSRFFRSIAGH